MPNPARTAAAFVLVAVVAATGSVLPASPGSAATPEPVVSAVPAAGTWGTNGTIYSQLRLGGRLYIAGKFSALVDPAGSAPDVPASNIAALDAVTGRPVSGWSGGVPAGGTVFTLAASPDGQTLYAGGNFTFTAGDGTERRRLAAFDAATGNLSPWAGQAAAIVRALVVTNDKVVVGGDFAGGVKALNPVTGARISTFNVTTGPGCATTACSGNVRALALSAAGDRIYVGGHFGTVNGAVRPAAAAVSVSTGALDTRFAPPLTAEADPRDNVVLDFATQIPGHLYMAIGGYLNLVTDSDPITGRERWRNYADGDFQTVTALGQWVYAGGHFSKYVIDHTGKRHFRVHAVRLDGASGGVDTAWQPVLNPVVTPYFFGVWSLIHDGVRLYAGGEFQTVDGAARPSFALFRSSLSSRSAVPTTSPRTSPRTR